MRHLPIVALSAMATMCAGDRSPVAPTRPVPGNDLVAEVARGGLVLFFRHASRDAGAITNEALALADRTAECVPGSELTAEGIADALAIGNAFKELSIRVDHVLASPTCRTTQMARLAFGAHEVTPALAYPDVWPENEAEHVAALRRLLSTPPRPGTVTVLVAHNNVLVPARTDFDLTLDQAEAAVLRPLGDRAELAGRVKKSDWLSRAPATPSRVPRVGFSVPFGPGTASAAGALTWGTSSTRPRAARPGRAAPGRAAIPAGRVRG